MTPVCLTGVILSIRFSKVEKGNPARARCPKISEASEGTLGAACRGLAAPNQPGKEDLLVSFPSINYLTHFFELSNLTVVLVDHLALKE